MQPSVLLKCMTVLGWDAAALASQLGCHLILVHQWMRGTSLHGVPPAVAAWLMRRMELAQAEPVPVGWRTGKGRLNGAHVSNSCSEPDKEARL